MATHNMRDALKASLDDEEQAVADRFAKADSYFTSREEYSPSPARDESPAPVSARAKVIRDGFTMPEDDYTKIRQMQDVCLAAGMSVTKSEVLRAGLHLLERLSAPELKELFHSLEKMKPGRPAR
jgi:hypothetical protein